MTTTTNWYSLSGDRTFALPDICPPAPENYHRGHLPPVRFMTGMRYSRTVFAISRTPRGQKSLALALASKRPWPQKALASSSLILGFEVVILEHIHGLGWIALLGLRLGYRLGSVVMVELWG